MPATLTPLATPRRIAALTGFQLRMVESVFTHLYENGVDLRDCNTDRAMAAVQCHFAGHTGDAVELVTRWPHIGETSWLVSTEAAAKIFPNLLQAVAFIDQHGPTTYRLSPLGLMLRGRY